MNKKFEKVKNFAIYFIKKNSETATTLASTHLAYYLLLSLIPLLMIIFQVLVLVVPNIGDLFMGLTENLPNDVKNIINPIIDNFANSSSSSISIVAILSAVWAASRGFKGLKIALNSIFGVHTKSKIPFFDLIFSVIYTVVFFVLLILLMLFTVFNEKIVDFIKSFTNNYEILDAISGILIEGIGFLMPFLLSIIVFIFFYRYAPSFNRETRITFLESLIGAVVATLLIAGITLFYRISNDVITKSPSIYGSLGSILVSLVWLLGICQMIVYGALFTKTYIDVVLAKRTPEDLDREHKLIERKNEKLQESIRRESDDSQSKDKDGIVDLR